MASKPIPIDVTDSVGEQGTIPVESINKIIKELQKNAVKPVTLDDGKVYYPIVIPKGSFKNGQKTFLTGNKPKNVKIPKALQGKTPEQKEKEDMNELQVALPEVPDDLDSNEAGHYREQILIQVNNNLAWSFVIAGKMLYEIKASGWLTKCDMTMATFLADKKLSFGASTAAKLMKIYRTLVLKHGVTPATIAEIGDYEKAYLVCGMIGKGNMELKDALDHAKENSRGDLLAIKKEVNKEDSGPSSWKLSQYQWKIMIGLLGFAVENRYETISVTRQFLRTVLSMDKDTMKKSLIEARKMIV